MVKIRIKKVEMYGYKVGDIIDLGDRPTQKWRNAIKESEIDDNIEILMQTPKINKKNLKSRSLNNDNDTIS